MFESINVTVELDALNAQHYIIGKGSSYHLCSVASNSATQWSVAHQAPLSMEFSRQECWRGLPSPTPGDLTNPGIDLTSLTSPALAGRFFTTVSEKVKSTQNGRKESQRAVSRREHGCWVTKPQQMSSAYPLTYEIDKSKLVL